MLEKTISDDYTIIKKGPRGNESHTEYLWWAFSLIGVISAHDAAQSIEASPSVERWISSAFAGSALQYLEPLRKFADPRSGNFSDPLTSPNGTKLMQYTNRTIGMLAKSELQNLVYSAGLHPDRGPNYAIQSANYRDIETIVNRSLNTPAREGDYNRSEIIQVAESMKNTDNSQYISAVIGTINLLLDNQESGHTSSADNLKTVILAMEHASMLWKLRLVVKSVLDLAKPISKQPSESKLNDHQFDRFQPMLRNTCAYNQASGPAAARIYTEIAAIQDLHESLVVNSSK